VSRTKCRASEPTVKSLDAASAFEDVELLMTAAASWAETERHSYDGGVGQRPPSDNNPQNTLPLIISDDAWSNRGCHLTT
jgi:hypothetical protein